MSEPRSNLAFASKLLDDGLSEDEVVARLAERDVSEKEARKLVRKLHRAEARPSLTLSYVVVGLGALMILFGVWVIVNAYNDPEVMRPNSAWVDSAGNPYVPLIRRMWRVTLICWACGGAVLGSGVYKLRRAMGVKVALPTPPVELTGPGPTSLQPQDLRRYATKELVKGRSKDEVIGELIARGVAHELARTIVGSAR